MSYFNFKFMDWIQLSWLQNHFEETVYFLFLIPQEFLVLIWSISEGWKTEVALEPTCVIEPWTTGFGIQHPGYWAIAQ